MIFSDDSQATQNNTRNGIATRGRYVHTENSVRPILQTTIDMLTALEPAPSIPATVQSTPAATAPQKTKRSLFSVILDTTVEVDRVTRQSVQAVRHSFEPPHISAMRTHRQKLLVRWFYAVGSVSFAAAMVLGIYSFAHVGTPKQVTSTGVLGAQTNPNDATRLSETPAETKPTDEDIATYLVTPAYPRYLRIPTINVTTRIRRLGIDSKGAVGTPNNIYDSGWYDASVKPGDMDGASVIEGHVAGPTQHGVFWDLNKLVYGDTIQIEKGSGEVVTYKVTKTEKVPADQLSMRKYLNSEVLGRNDLKLITAAGKYNIINGVYDTRLVVYAQQQ